jgi:hypothetical protein
MGRGTEENNSPAPDAAGAARGKHQRLRLRLAEPDVGAHEQAAGLLQGEPLEVARPPERARTCYM